MAIDKASLDLIAKAQPLPQSKAEGLKVDKDSDVLSMIHRKDSMTQIRTAEKMGLGTSDYKLIEV